ncbi:MAG: hypothetical protein ACI93T_002262, partial [Porticoccaceae bacterium]
GFHIVESVLPEKSIVLLNGRWPFSSLGTFSDLSIPASALVCDHDIE